MQPRAFLSFFFLEKRCCAALLASCVVRCPQGCGWKWVTGEGARSGRHRGSESSAPPPHRSELGSHCCGHSVPLRLAVGESCPSNTHPATLKSKSKCVLRSPWKRGAMNAANRKNLANATTHQVRSHDAERLRVEHAMRVDEGTLTLLLETQAEESSFREKRPEVLDWQ